MLQEDGVVRTAAQISDRHIGSPARPALGRTADVPAQLAYGIGFLLACSSPFFVDRSALWARHDFVTSRINCLSVGTDDAPNFGSRHRDIHVEVGDRVGQFVSRAARPIPWNRSVLLLRHPNCRRRSCASASILTSAVRPCRGPLPASRRCRCWDRPRRRPRHRDDCPPPPTRPAIRCRCTFPITSQMVRNW